MSQTWMIISGKGGVGKSMITSALGIALARREMSCCCVDMDIGLRNLDMLLGMQNKVVYDVLDVAHKDCKLKYALISHALHSNLSLLPAAQLGDVSEMDAEDMARIVKKLKKRFGYVLLDAPAGIGRGVNNLLPSVDHEAVDTGLKYVNNDICYPSILVCGQLINAVLSGKYDLARTAVLISQTGGKNGGGARLTPEGKDLLERYDRFVKESREALDVVYARCFEGMGKA